MSVVNVAITPTLSKTTGPNAYTFPTGITQSKVDTVRFTMLCWLIKQIFSQPGVITTPTDTVSLTVTIDGTDT